MKEEDRKAGLSHTLNEGMWFSNQKNSRHNYNDTEEKFLRIIFLRYSCFNIFKIYQAINVQHKRLSNHEYSVVTLLMELYSADYGIVPQF